MTKRWMTIAAGTLLFAATATAWAEPPASVTGVNGAPTVVRGGRTEKIAVGAKVEVGDEIRTDAAAKVQITLADKSVLTVGPETRVKLDAFTLGPDSRKTRLSVLLGRFRLAVEKFAGSTDYEVETPTAVAGVRGTVIWGDTELDAICALEGHVEVRSRKGTAVAEFGAGNCVQGMAEGQTRALVPTADQLAAYLKQVTLD